MIVVKKSNDVEIGDELVNVGIVTYINKPTVNHSYLYRFHCVRETDPDMVFVSDWLVNENILVNIKPNNALINI
jgi:hypothetical protein